jgi:uncharacterized protein (DUF4415 family)
MPASKRALKSDLSKIDAHAIEPEEYEEIPELGEEWFDTAERRDGGKLAPRRGRPKLERPKELVTIRLDHEVVEGFRKAGPGWQSRINAALRGYLEAARKKRA